MYTFLEGILESATPLQVVINVNGMGFAVEVPVTTSEKLPSPGSQIRLFVHPVFREDSQSLYGFNSPEERDFFRKIIEKVSGIGPRIGLNLLSRLSMPTVLQAIQNGDAALLSKCPGIGRKTAERICVDLRDKLPSTLPVASRFSSGSSPASPSDPSPVQDAVQALITLGFKPDAADKAVRSALQSFEDTPNSPDALIRRALKGT